MSFLQSILHFFRSLFGSDDPDPSPTAPPVKDKPADIPAGGNVNTTKDPVFSTAKPADTPAKVMKVKVERTDKNETDIAGKLFIDGKEVCLTLETATESGKKGGRIPEGDYPIELRTEGGFHATYLYRFGALHKGMLWIRNVPKNEFVFIHTGNTYLHTSGSILPGEKLASEPSAGTGRALLQTEEAYTRVYGIIANHLAGGGTATLHVADKFLN
jgi:hypothetical protein